jgi:Bacteriophage abortive infection AbiH
MKNPKLYIIGNGFDLHHGIPSEFADFKEFVREHDSDLLKAIESYLLAIREDWKDLESALATIEVEGIVNDLEHFMTSYGADDWSDSGHHDFQYEVSRVVECLSVELRRRLCQWICQVPIPTPETVSVRLPTIDQTALFLTFNYTPTLQKLYSVPDTHILHIHGRANRSDDNLILGHAWNPGERPSLNDRADIEELDTRLIEAHGILDRYFSDTFKPSARLIREHSCFFERLANLEEVCVLGHSLSAVDSPYFHALLTVAGAASAQWRVACYEESDFLTMPKALLDLGIKASRITPSSWSDF